MAEKVFKRIDWLLVFFIVPIIAAGLVTMKSFAALEASSDFFSRQIIWVALSLTVFFVFSFIDFRFLKRTNVLVFLFLAMWYLVKLVREFHKNLDPYLPIILLRINAIITNLVRPPTAAVSSART